MQHKPENQARRLDKNVVVRMPMEDIEFLRGQGRQNERTVSGEIRRLVREYRDAVEERQAA
jgi:hypothetical protein